MNETFIVVVHGKDCRIPRALHLVMKNQPELLVEAFNRDSSVRLTADFDRVFHLSRKGDVPTLRIERRDQDGAFIAWVGQEWWEVDTVALIALGVLAPCKGDSTSVWSLYRAVCDAFGESPAFDQDPVAVQ